MYNYEHVRGVLISILNFIVCNFSVHLYACVYVCIYKLYTVYIMIMTLSMCFELFVHLEHDYCEIVTTLIMYNIQIILIIIIILL